MLTVVSRWFRQCCRPIQSSALQALRSCHDTAAVKLFLTLGSLIGLGMLLGVLVVFSPATAHAAGWETGPGYRRLKVEPNGTGKDGFTLLAPETTGIRFTNFLSEPRGLGSQILPSGLG